MPAPARERTARLPVRLALIAILAVAAALRLYGIAWDGGMLFHPDERHILVVANGIAFPPLRAWGTLLSPESPWNPQFFAYGSLPIYLLRIMADLAGRLDPSYATLQSSYVVGRTLSALFDLGTVALVFRLGFRLFDERVGLLAAALTTVTVLHVQLAHFFAVDTLLAFFVLLTVDLAIDLVDRPTLWRGVGVGAAWGAALATKVSAAPLGMAVAVAWVLGTLASRETNRRSERSEERRPGSRGPSHTFGTTWPHRRSGRSEEPRRASQGPSHPFGTTLPQRRSGRSEEPRPGSQGPSHPFGTTLPRRRSERSEEPRLAEAAPLVYAASAKDTGARALATSRPPARPRRGGAALRGTPPRQRVWTFPLRGMVVTGLVALVTFVLCEPYAVIDAATFAADVAQESQMARGAYDIPYTRQFIGTLPYVYPIQQAIVWSMGIPLGIAGFVAMVVAAVRGCLAAASRSWRRAGDFLVPLAWVLPYLGIVGAFHAKFLRYLLPILPFLSLWAAWMLVGLLRAGGRRLARAVGWGALATVVAGSALYAVAYLNIYAETHPWIQTTAWMCRNLPAGSRIAVEHWDDTLPLLQGTGELRCSRQHLLTQLAVYNRDDQAKLEMLLNGIEGNDYIVLASNRLYNTIPRLPGRYPLTSRYYHLLLGEELGFELVHTAATYPRVFGVDLVHDTFHDPDLPKPALLSAVEAQRRSLVLGRADESYSVYDHPMTMVFQKVEPLSREELLRRFGDVAQDLPAVQ